MTSLFSGHIASVIDLFRNETTRKLYCTSVNPYWKQRILSMIPTDSFSDIYALWIGYPCSDQEIYHASPVIKFWKLILNGEAILHYLHSNHGNHEPYLP